MRILLAVMLFAFTGVANAAEVNDSKYDIRPSVALKSLADQSKAARQTAGGIIMGLGVLTTAMLLSDNDDDDYYYDEPSTDTSDALIVGGIFVGLGAIPLLMKSEPEHAWMSVQQIENSVEREDTAYSKLVDLADQARHARYLSATINVALAGYLYSQSNKRQYDEYGYTEYDYTPNAVILGIWGAYGFLVPSRAERTVKRLQDGKKWQDMQASSLTVGFNGNVRTPGLALRYNF